MKATLDDTDVTIHEAAFDSLGRRVVKTVSNSGDLGMSSGDTHFNC